MICFAKVLSRSARIVVALLFLTGGALLSLAAEPKVAVKEVLDPEHAAKMARGLDLFKTHVRPLFTQKCLRCHGGQKTESEFDLVDRQGLLKGGLLGPAIVAGKAKDSLLYKLISHAKEPRMPKSAAKLPAESIAQVAAWIDLGAPYDQPLVPRDDQAAWTRKVVTEEAKQFWSFQSLRRIEPPSIKDGGWCKTLADRFILAKLEEAGLKPNPAVSRRQLIRRAYFDLIGLPPTPEEIEKFVNDPASDAYEKLIDHLLASSHYGERWGRHWLDLVRFAESHGFEHDYDRPSAYHYRDFVIQALNQDQPYDTFVKWQIAGDEYEPENNLALTATGFLAAGVHSTQITKNEVEKHRYDEMDDMLATTSTSMLGLTVGCARCHDHKYDPFPARDYYQLLSSFTTTVRSEIDLNLDPKGYRIAKAAFDREHAPLEASLAKFETEQLPARWTAWEKTWPTQQDKYPWTILDLTSFKSAEGATFAKLGDGSLLAAGKNGKFDTYTLTAQANLAGVTALRLEALAEASMVKGGPGRAANGNFDLTDFKVVAAGKDGKTPTPLKLKNPRATFQQKNLPIAAAIDDNPQSGWAVDPEFGKDHAAVFELDPTHGLSGETTLAFTLQFKGNDGHNLGRIRLAVSGSKPQPTLQGEGIPQQVRTLLTFPAEKRTADQLGVLLKWYRSLEPEWQKLNKAVQNHLLTAPKPNLVKALISSEGLQAVRLHTQGEDNFPDTYFLKRGDPNQKEGKAGQGFLQVLMTGPEKEKRWLKDPPKGWRTTYRRRALAEWLTDVDRGAGKLLARVIVNRLWHFHMGRGIVATPSDFGNRGEPPTHPELLDWLAAELIKGGWRLKPIHKLIMTSATYMQSSDLDGAKAKIDSDNQLFWRRPRHRLEAEVIRDALLAIGNALDTRMFGPGTLEENSRRRSIYFTVKRSKLMPMMQVFDSPEPLSGVGNRPTTTIAPQALLLMNNPNVRDYAKGFAKRIHGDGNIPIEEALKRGYLTALGRPPAPDELADSVAFVKAQAESYRAAGKGDGRQQALADFGQVLMCLNEFIYVD